MTVQSPTTAFAIPPGRRMGHAWAIVPGSNGDVMPRAGSVPADRLPALDEAMLKAAER